MSDNIVIAVVLGCAFGSLACSLFVSRRRKPDSPCAVNHDPVILSAQPVAIEEHAAVILPYPHTAVLARCARCNNRWSYMMVGKWSVEELTLSEATAIKERTELERLARQ